MELANFEKISLKRHPELDERWVQHQIAENPNLLGLGDVILKDKERVQPRAGRLDLLLQEIDLSRRYEVEVQLGATDESHIIRTIEYWDIERKRYPQYEHTAVIVAEDITSRFLNVIALFNGVIPLIAIQMSALKIDNRVGLVFTTVLDQLSLGLVDEDEEIQEVADREYWENRGSNVTVAMADEILKLAKGIDSALELKYNKFYIGMARHGITRNFVTLKPKKEFLRFEPRLMKTEETTAIFEDAGLDVMEYSRTGRYRIRLKPGDIENHRAILADVLNKAYESSKID